MKITLIQCPVWGTYDPPLALAQLSACLKKEGHDVYVYDLNIELYLKRTGNYRNMWAWEQSDFWHNPQYMEKFFLDNSGITNQFIGQIFKQDMRMVGFSVNSGSRLSSLEMAKKIKKKKKDITVVFGGPLFLNKSFIESILGEEFVDVVIPQESEIALLKLAKIIEQGGDISCCEGIAFKTNGSILKTASVKLADLNSLPYLDFRDTPLSNYDDSEHIPLVTSRGCIWQCAFCSDSPCWPGYKTMSGERVFQEIKYHKEQFKDLGHVDFFDLVFNGSMKKFISFCDLMVEANFGIAWSVNCIIRPEMTPDVLERAKRAGCEHIIYGIESGSQRILDLMRKRYKIEVADKVLKATHDVGILTTGNFMFGFPQETEEDFQLTLECIKRNAKYLDRVYPSRTYFALEEFSYVCDHPEEFGIKPNFPNHLYWESIDGTNTYPERLRRCEEFCNLASSLGIEVGCGVQTSVELDRWFSLGHYYEHKKDYEKTIDCFLKYYDLDPKNDVVLDKIKSYSKKIEENNPGIIISQGLASKLKTIAGITDERLHLKSNFSISENSQGQRRFTWNIHYECNFRCPYCFFEGKWDEYHKRNVYLSVDEWMRYWNKIWEKYGRCYILITGGEPFIYPNFIELIEGLSQVHYPINISTNASGDLESFVKKIDHERVSLSVSFQPDFDDLKTFLEKVRFLKEHKIDGCINFVAYPPYLKDIKGYVEKFALIGETLKVIPFWGKYQEKDYPVAYSQKEKELIGIDELWFNKVRKKGALCPAGNNSALIFPDGKIARCGQIGEKMLIGNFFDPEFKLLDEPLPCDAESCPCGEDRLFDEEQNVTITYENQKKDERINNSSLNDEEYNSRKIILESSPKTIFIQAGGSCNSNCAFCSRGFDYYEIFNLDIHQRRFEEKLYPFISKAEELIFTGSGEFLLLPEAVEILNFFDGRFPYTKKIFSTNGSTLIPQICEKIVSGQSKYTIHISLHASNSRLHKVLTRTDNFYKIIGQVKYLLNLRKDKSKPEVRLIFVATTLNIEDLPNFIRLAYQLGVDKVICYYNYIYIPTQKYLSCFFRQEMANRMLDEAERMAKDLNMEIELPPRFGLKDYPKRGVCREPWSQIMLDSQGHVLPCDAAEDCDVVLDASKEFMDDVWNSTYYQNLRKNLINRTSMNCFQHCFRANPESVNDFKSHVIHRGNKSNIDILWGDNFKDGRNPRADSAV